MQLSFCRGCQAQHDPHTLSSATLLCVVESCLRQQQQSVTEALLRQCCDFSVAPLFLKLGQRLAATPRATNQKLLPSSPQVHGQSSRQLYNVQRYEPQGPMAASFNTPSLKYAMRPE